MITHVIIIFGAIILLVVGTTLIMGVFWSRTRHGKLNYKAAVILKLRGVFMGEEQLDPEIMRLEEIARFKSLERKVGKNARARDLTISGPHGLIPLRLYYPDTGRNLPVFIFLHGGGWVTGDLTTCSNICQMYAQKIPALVVAVDYRLAPENKYPAAADDAYAALEWVSGHISEYGGNPQKIAVGGDSAGGNLAAAVTLMARDRSGPELKYQVLIYPTIDASKMDTDSYDYFADGYGLTRDHMNFFYNSYVPNKKDRQHPYVSPVLAKDLGAVPPAMVMTAGFDILRDEGIAYAERLKAAGVETRHIHYSTMIHGFISMSRIFGEAFDAVDTSADAARAAFK